MAHCFGENYMVATFTPTIGFLGSNLITLRDLKTPLLLSKDSNYSSTSLRGLPSLPMTIRSRWTKLRSRTRIMLLNKSVSKASKVSVQFSGWTQARPLAPIIGSVGLIWNVGGPVSGLSICGGGLPSRRDRSSGRPRTTRSTELGSFG